MLHGHYSSTYSVYDSFCPRSLFIHYIPSTAETTNIILSLHSLTVTLFLHSPIQSSSSSSSSVSAVLHWWLLLLAICFYFCIFIAHFNGWLYERSLSIPPVLPLLNTSYPPCPWSHGIRNGTRLGRRNERKEASLERLTWSGR